MKGTGDCSRDLFIVSRKSDICVELVNCIVQGRTSPSLLYLELVGLSEEREPCNEVCKWKSSSCYFQHKENLWQVSFTLHLFLLT